MAVLRRVAQASSLSRNSQDGCATEPFWDRLFVTDDPSLHKGHPLGGEKRQPRRRKRQRMVVVLLLAFWGPLDGAAAAGLAAAGEAAPDAGAAG